jgi:hypothetical protein
MTRTALAIAAALCLLAPWRASPEPGKARDVALEALALKADLPAMRPALPSLLRDRDAALRADPAGDRKKGPAKAAGEARGAARSEAAKANAAAARSEAVRAAAEAKEDSRSAKEKVREEKTRKKPKPPRPDGGASP